MLKEYYEDCAVGDQVRSPGRTITEADVVAFAGLSGDWNPLHTDDEYARATPFGRRIAHGLLGLVATSGLLARTGWFVTSPRSQTIISSIDKARFVAPVFFGDTVTLEAEVVEKKMISDDRGLITLRLRLKNQRDEVVITLRMGLVVACRPAEQQP